uniref:Peptidase M14 domain-containing protein n=1 Tax=Odontella aurita TaxID=265563 RepID=A0A7S4J2W9_9STRA|eukprot:CAMPEP_0113556962 /NCGR_PEP_ID=MMETSP0015_2-20120614/17536_1 /TAXON_ID=2838 /ORGANISM="Odontella" /LENGTH=366 /DNA_ID=CAMNT_0000458353 /DNA_START=61 /DNA_END=1161 /DNA_ORIENTATION=+ /assembly_acc=CAM_ASM_000160
MVTMTISPARFVAGTALIMTTISSLSTATEAYHPSKIGTTGKPWGIDEYNIWRDTRQKQRCYLTDVVPKIQALSELECSHTKEPLFEVVRYGDLVHHGDEDPDKFPLYAVRSINWSEDKPNVFITGGVHGYETSGVEGALLFLSGGKAEHYSRHFNVLVVPCVSPWGYERIQRWTAKGTDPNRSFNPDGEIVEGRSFNPEAATDESAALITFLREEMGHVKDWTCHLDLHETTDTDETEFRPAKNSRDGLGSDDGKGEIPDGFYLVQDETSMKEEWFKAMIDSVREVTHIAPADTEGKIIGEKVTQEGVIVIPCKKSLGLCAGVTNAPYRTTTEVYPDSPNATPEICNRAQVACIEGALDHIISVI